VEKEGDGEKEGGEVGERLFLLGRTRHNKKQTERNQGGKASVNNKEKGEKTRKREKFLLNSKVQEKGG